MKSGCCAFFLLLILYSCGQQNKKESSSEYLDGQSLPVIKSFFESVQSGQYKAALEDLLKKNDNIDLQDSMTLVLKKKFNDINESSGKFVSDRLLRKKQIGDDLGVYSYFVRYEKKFYRFIFTFYNNGSQVKVYKFSFDDTIDVELEEAIRLYVN